MKKADFGVAIYLLAAVIFSLRNESNRKSMG